jgi:hypothetical protein
MNVPITVAILIVIATCFSVQFGLYPQLSQGILYENGTCTNEKLTNSYNQINTNGTVGDFLKSLPSDNSVLASLVCENISNETIVK